MTRAQRRQLAPAKASIFSAMIGLIPWKLGFARAFAASSKSFSKQRSTPPSGGIDMNALRAAAAIPPRALSARARAIGSVV